MRELLDSLEFVSHVWFAMSTRSLSTLFLVLLSFAAVVFFWRPSREEGRERPDVAREGAAASPSVAATPIAVPRSGLPGAALSPSQLLSLYSCVGCGTATAEASPFVAESEADAVWMATNAFPSIEKRQWTDRATLAEVETRARVEASDIWALELIRKRCAVGDPAACVREEIGRALQLADVGRVYAYYVVAESHLKLAESRDESLPAAVVHASRRNAARDMFRAALRGDSKADGHLEFLARKLEMPWSAEELQAAAFASISMQQVEAASVAASGRVPRQWPPRPTRALTSTVQGLVEYEASARRQHAAPATVTPPGSGG